MDALEDDDFYREVVYDPLCHGSVGCSLPTLWRPKSMPVDLSFRTRANCFFIFSAVL